MSKMNDWAGIFAQDFKAAAFRSAPGFNPYKTNAARAQLVGVRRHRPVGGHVKRAIDVALALIALVLLAPMFVLIAILLRVGLGRPVLVAEHHIGFAGEVFTAYTFHTSSIQRARELATTGPSRPVSLPCGTPSSTACPSCSASCAVT